MGRLAEPDVMAGESFEHLHAEPLVLVMRRGHAFLKRHAAGKAALAELARVPLVLPLPGTILRQLADAFLLAHGVVPRAGTVETLDVPLSRALVLDGSHAWFTALGAAGPDLDDARMQRVDLAITPRRAAGPDASHRLRPAARVAGLRRDPAAGSRPAPRGEAGARDR